MINKIKSLGQLLNLNRIRNRLIVSITVVHVVLMSIFVFHMVNRQRKFLLEQNQAQSLNVANELAENAGVYIVKNDLDELERIIQSQSNFHNLKYSMIVSPEGKILAHTKRLLVGQVATDHISRKITKKTTPQILHESSEMLDIAIPIQVKQEILGIARIGFSKAHINESLNTVIRDGIWYIIVALLIGTIVAFLIGSSLSSGLYTLIDTANKIKLGDRNMRVEPLKIFELQTLGMAFNGMIDEISVNELKFRNLVEKSLVGIYIIQNNRFAYVNPQIITDSGFSEAELYQKSIFDLVLPEDWQVVNANMVKREMNKAETVQYEVRTKTRNNTIFWLEIFGTISLYNGAPALIGTMVNITKRKAVYDDLKISEANLKSMFETTDVAYLLLNSNYDIEAFNQHMTEIHEQATSKALYVGDNYFDAVRPEKGVEIRALYERVMQNNEAEDFEVSYLKNGIPQHYTANVKPIRDGQKPIGLCISSINITERKNAIEQLKQLNQSLQQQTEELNNSNADLEQAKKRYSELFNFSPLPKWVADAKTFRFLDINKAAELHYGYSRDEFLSMTLRDIRPVEEIPYMEEMLVKTRNEKKAITHMIMVHKKKTGELINVELQIAPITYSGTEAYLTVAINLNERLKYINAIESQNKRLLEISWIQSHIARAPLARLIALIPMLNNEENSPEDRDKILGYMLTSANELDEIIKSITDKAKIEQFNALKPDIDKQD